MKHWNDKCALFGAWNCENAGEMAYFGLYAQQHRGQEGAGIVSVGPSGAFCIKKGLGLVAEVFENCVDRLQGHAVIGHTRYSTRGQSQDEHSIQPLTAELETGSLALAHNGNFVNFSSLKKSLLDQGCVFEGSGDTECLIHLLRLNSQPSHSFATVLKQSLSSIEGAYSLVLLNKESLTAVRDPRGFRPLVLGKKKKADGDDAWFIASETCAFDLLGAEYVREIECGEILTISKKGLSSEWIEKKEERKACIFESIYFSRPDSVVFGNHVYKARKAFGRALALQAPVEADLTTPVPDSGLAAALGYSEASGIPYEMGIIRNHYVGRTFIQPTPKARSFRVKIKLNPQKHVIGGKSIVVVDDSLVRGTTAKAIVKILRQAGAKKIHFRIASPPVTDPCHYGVDTPEKSQLISAQKSLTQLTEFLQVDSLEFLSVENMLKAVQGSGYCHACFTGKYPTPVY